MTCQGVVTIAKYHVNNQAIGASDGNSGSASAPFATLARANTVAVSGDTVLVSEGVYREQLTCKNSGVDWKAFTRGVYLYGSESATGIWTPTATEAFTLSYTATTQPLVVLVDTVPLSPASSADTTVNGQFFYDSTAEKLYVDLGGTDPTGKTIEVGTRSTCISLLNVTDCSIEGFSVYASNGYGILILGGGNHIVRDNEVIGHPSGGIRLQPQSPQLFKPTDNGVGGTLGSGEYSYQVSATIGGEETLPSFALGVTVSANHTIQLQWSKVPAASSFNIYGRSAVGKTLLAVVANSFGSNFPSFVDDGGLSPDGTTLPPLSSAIGLSPCAIESNNVWRNLSHGIYLFGASSCYIRGNSCHHNLFHGIALLNGSNSNIVEFNTCYLNARGNRTANGIQADNFGLGSPGSRDNIIQYNRCFRNEDSGISIYNGSNDCTVRGNIVYLNGDHGIDNLNATNCHMTNNLCYKNTTAGLNAEGSSSGIRMFNNISMDNGVQSPRTSGNYRIDSTAGLDAQLDHNLSYLTVPASLQPGGAGLSNSEISWGNSKYSTLALFRSAVATQMIHSVSKDPLFNSAGRQDFKLQYNSPAAGLGTASAPSFSDTDFFGRAMGSSPNAGPIA